MKENILITGAGGMVGSYFDSGIRLDRTALDITNLAAVREACRAAKPSATVHLAAYNDLAAAEADPTQAYMVNTVGTFNMALAAREVGAKLVYVSTSGVFDGTKKEPYVESDTPNPVNAYGRTKYLGELAVKGVLEDYLIVRTSWVFGGGPLRDKKFVGKMLRQQGNEPFRATTDRRGSPTYAKDLAAAILKFIEEDRRGIVHAGGAAATRFDVAREVAAIAGLGAPVEPALAADFPSVYQSGENESMEPSTYMRPWQEGLAEYIKTEWKMGGN